MIISILGTGMVARSLAGRIAALGHQVFMGTRDKATTLDRPLGSQGGPSFASWLQEIATLQLVNLEELPQETELFINATNGSATLSALTKISDRLKGKVLLDIANPLDFSNGMPPTLSICNDDSLGETIQRDFPDCKVVKSLNTMNAHLMVNPILLEGDHSVFMSGNDKEAKEKVKSLLVQFGWQTKNIIDLGDIKTARGSEMLLPIWLRLWGVLNTAEFNFNIVRKD
ncbi:MAG: NAD(P)-binding domain-containing protein [Saprospiraceae bacterium]|nr:NAD(P)-binding domain-containing protein [Saprospiraceae bacterium]